MAMLKRRRYKVGVRKEYFPRHLWPTGVGESYHLVYRVVAANRSEAARLIWERHGMELLQRMLPDRRKVSLDVNDPAIGITACLGRLVPITVYQQAERLIT